MAIFRVPFGSAAIALLLVTFIAGLSLGESLAPAPGPNSDGTSIDQGIGYLLMLVALVLTYIIHPLDASDSLFKFF